MYAHRMFVWVDREHLEGRLEYVTDVKEAANLGSNVTVLQWRYNLLWAVGVQAVGRGRLRKPFYSLIFAATS